MLDLVDRTKEVQTAQALISKVPFDKEAVDLLDDEQAELRKRAAMAGDIARVAALFADITNSGAPTDAAKAAGDLGKEIGSIKAFAGGNEADALKVTAAALVNVIKARDDVKAAKLMEPVASSLSVFFDKEVGSYVSFANSYYLTAASNTNALIDRDQVTHTFLYRSSLQPFGLSPAITDPTLRKGAVEGLKTRVQLRLADRQLRDQAAGTALSESLHVMRDRITLVAHHKEMRATLPPLTLEGVKAWVLEVKTDLGE
ncbi:MAG: hypothetical protein ACRYF4_12900 [Janthinobacterium lividum]